VSFAERKGGRENLGVKVEPEEAAARDPQHPTSPITVTVSVPIDRVTGSAEITLTIMDDKTKGIIGTTNYDLTCRVTKRQF
jgi:hypothetical protein